MNLFLLTKPLERKFPTAFFFQTTFFQSYVISLSYHLES